MWLDSSPVDIAAQNQGNSGWVMATRETLRALLDKKVNNSGYWRLSTDSKSSGLNWPKLIGGEMIRSESPPPWCSAWLSKSFWMRSRCEGAAR